MKRQMQVLVVCVAALLCFGLYFANQTTLKERILTVLIQRNQQANNEDPNYNTPAEYYVSNNSQNTYIVALHYWEQVANAASSLFGLQCWAGSLDNTRVVQPHIGTKTLQLPPDESTNEFSDFFNVSVWNEFSTSENYATLVSWSEFLSKAPKNVVYVHILYNNEGKCSGFSANTKWLENLGFQISSEVCIELPNTEDTLLTLEQFNRRVFSGRESPSEPVTVVINQCRGVQPYLGGPKTRLMIKDIECKHSYVRNNTTKIRICKATPSEHALKEAEEYSKTHLNISGQDYISVMVRFEALMLHRKPVKGAMEDCLRLIRQYNETKVFVTTDVDGLYGSQSFGRADQSLSKDFMKQLREENPQKSFVQFDSSKVTGLKHPQYINWLQGIIAAKARHLVTVGEGLYQVLVRCIYNDLNAL